MSSVPDAEAAGARIEKFWAWVSILIVASLVFIATFTGVHRATMPQARLETVDPRTLHLEGEFIESNLGSAVEADGSVTVRLVGQQYSFTPQCILVPVDTPVRFRTTSADVVHGFLIEKTNVNVMLVPGYITSTGSRFPKLGEYEMPCHEFCGMGHEGMWARVRVIDKSQFAGLVRQRRRVDCAGQ